MKRSGELVSLPERFCFGLAFVNHRVLKRIKKVPLPCAKGSGARVFDANVLEKIIISWL